MQAKSTPKAPETQSVEPIPIIEPSDNIVTTEDEWEGYYFIKAILHDVIDPSKVVMRDAKSYCAILFEDNNRKPICRFYFDGKQKYLGLFNSIDKKENKVAINSIQELFKHGEELKTTIALYKTSIPQTQKESS